MTGRPLFNPAVVHVLLVRRSRDVELHDQTRLISGPDPASTNGWAPRSVVAYPVCKNGTPHVSCEMTEQEVNLKSVKFCHGAKQQKQAGHTGQGH